MKGARRVACAAIAVLVLGSTVSSQEAPPLLTAPVNDFANVIDSEDEAALDSLIRKLESASGDVLVVATVKTFAPAADIRRYANEMFENHGRGIGQKGRDNGMLLLLAVEDRDVWAEVGYDLEGIITDGFAGETSRQVMVPFFRQGNYGDGLVAGATRFAQRIAEARKVTLDGVPTRALPRDDEGEIPLILIIFAAIMVINVVRAAMSSAFGGTRRRGRRRWTSTVGPFGTGYGGWSSGGGGWSRGGGGFGGGFGGFGGGRSGGGGGGASW